MNNQDNHTLSQKTRLIYLGLRFLNGCRKLWHNKRLCAGIIILCALCMTAVPWAANTLASSMETALAANLFRGIALIVGPLLVPVAMVLAIVRLGTPIDATIINDNMRRSGLTNSIGESPLLLAKFPDRNVPGMTEYEFYNVGIPLVDWEKAIEQLQAALNVYIGRIEQGKSMRRVRVFTAPVGKGFPEALPWDDTHMSDEDFVLVLGEDITTQPVTLNLDDTPHALFAGSTGSGKSWLLKLALMQCIRKGANVIIADRKRGIDFSADFWRENCPILTTEDAIEQQLAELVEEIDRRAPKFKEAQCDTLGKYNRKMKEKRKPALTRIIFACDEASQLLDKTGATKEEKEQIERMTGHLKTIARIGRSVGIHLIFAQQRPSADVLVGDIKNNMDFRVCGRADITLSLLILDNGDADKHIPKQGARGRFLTNFGILFQAYYWDDRATLGREGGGDYEHPTD